MSRTPSVEVDASTPDAPWGLLLAASADELRVLQELPGVRAGQLPASGAPLDPAVSVVVVGSGTSSAVAVVQRVHQLAPGSAVAVLVHPATEAELRRTLGYSPGIPIGVAMLPVDDRLPVALAELRHEADSRRRHQALMSAVVAASAAEPHRAAVPASRLGTLLEHAPLGVLLCDAQGRLIGWNRRAEDMLDLDPRYADQSVDAVLPGGAVLVRRVLPARDPGPAPTAQATGAQVRELVGPAGAAVEVSAVASQRDGGQPVALLLLIDVQARREAERARDELAAHVKVLAQVSESLMGTLDQEEALERLADIVVPALADWVSIQITGGDGRLGTVVMRHRDPAQSAVLQRARVLQAAVAAQAAPSRTAAKGQPVLIPEVTEQVLHDYVPDVGLRAAFAELGLRSVVAVPLPGRHGVLGSLVLVNGPGSRELGPADLAAATEIGQRAGIALDNARLYTAQRQLATELQRSLLTEPPRPAGAQIAVRYEAAAQEAQVGGDWYDAFVQPDGAVVLVIGDVVGHDTQAAAAMGQLRGLLRGIGYATRADPAEILTRVDEAMQGLLLATTATAVVANLEPVAPQGLRLRWSNAGHPPPVLLDPTGRTRVLHADGPQGDGGDLLLGIDPSTGRRTAEVLLPPGSTLLMYTDGLVERRGQSLDVGVQHLVEVLDRSGALGLDELCDEVLRRLVPADAEDDIAMVALRVDG